MSHNCVSSFTENVVLFALKSSASGGYPHHYVPEVYAVIPVGGVIRETNLLAVRGDRGGSQTWDTGEPPICRQNAPDCTKLHLKSQNFLWGHPRISVPGEGDTPPPLGASRLNSWPSATRLPRHELVPPTFKPWLRLCIHCTFYVILYCQCLRIS